VNGRKKNTIVLSTGRNVSPEWIEGELNSLPGIAQSFVFGEAEAHLSALIIAQHQSVSRDTIQLAIENLNQGLPAYARISSWHHLSEPFTVANGLLTTNGRPRRERILENLRTLIEEDAVSKNALSQPLPNFNPTQEHPAC
jgi:acyl-CoA synthetase (AMP-forming)/AMP-acid ligase II